MNDWVSFALGVAVVLITNVQIWILVLKTYRHDGALEIIAERQSETQRRLDAVEKVTTHAP